MGVFGGGGGGGGRRFVSSSDRQLVYLMIVVSVHADRIHVLTYCTVKEIAHEQQKNEVLTHLFIFVFQKTKEEKMAAISLDTRVVCVFG